jgi:chemotaxis regulatin CheY-phosphate phosphatase CheZ
LPYRIEYSPDAEDHLRALTARQQLIEQRLAAEDRFVQQQERQIQARVDQQIQITIAQDPNSVAGQIAKQLLPQLQLANARTVEALQKQVAEALTSLRAGPRASITR